MIMMISKYGIIMKNYKYTFKIKTLLMLFLCLLTVMPSFLSAQINIKSFGAVGDGNTDDTMAFIKALNMSKGEIYIPAGKYLLNTNNMVIPENISIRGAGGASVLIPSTNTATLFIMKSGSQLRDLSINGKNVKHGGVHDELIFVRNAERCVIERVNIKDCDRVCIKTDHATELLIKDCSFINIGLAINLEFSSRINVIGNTVKNARIHGIQFWGNWKWEQQGCEDLIFSGNYVKNGGRGAIWGAGGRCIIMNGNIIDGAEDVGLDLEWCEDSVINGNSVRNCKNGGISLFFACKNIAISGNTIVNNHTVAVKDKDAGYYVRSGIWLTPPNRQKLKNDYGHKNIAIVGNVIRSTDDGMHRRDMWIGSEVKNVRIESNVLSGYGIYYGGHNGVKPLRLKKLGKQPLLLNNMPTPDKPKH